ncbi:MAG: hypothetical protein ACFCVF_05045 [Kineosporiaceae bacterium]
MTTTTSRTTPGTSTTGRTRLSDVRARLPRTLTAGLDSLRDEVGRQLADPTPAYVALGAGDAVARRVGVAARHGAALAQRVRRDGGVEAGHLPRLAVGRALTLAGKVEEAYGEMATRGRDVARRARDGHSTSELVRLAVLTLDRARGAGDERRPTVVVGETVPTPPEPTDGPDGTAVPTAASPPAPATTDPAAPEADGGSAAEPPKAAPKPAPKAATKRATKPDTKPAGSGPSATARRAARTTVAGSESGTGAQSPDEAPSA